jgi:hypothetical protein
MRLQLEGWWKTAAESICCVAFPLRVLTHGKCAAVRCSKRLAAGLPRRFCTNLLVSIIAVAWAGTTASADDEITLRGVYYKERATRITQPMLDATVGVGDAGVANGHLLIDAITSASASSGADGSAFTEKRYEAGGGYDHQFARLKLGGEMKYSTEPDYRSVFGGGSATLDLAQKNTQITVGGGYSSDKITNAGAQGPFAAAIDGKMKSVLGYVSVTQILGTNTVAGVSMDLSMLRGYQQNPYRSAITDQGLVAERHPDKRLRQAYAVNGRHYVERTGTTIIGLYRYYRDDWGVVGHTPELRIVQEIGSSIDAALRLRYHRQSAADFYQDRYAQSDSTVQMYVSDDVKLSTFGSETIEAKLGVLGETFDLGGRWAGARFEGLLQYTVQGNRFGNAIVAHFALTVPFGGDYQ